MTSTDGVNWSAVQRIPIDAVNSTVDHFIPGLGVDRATSGATAHVSLTCYYVPNVNCTETTCQLFAGRSRRRTAARRGAPRRRFEGR